ncbi:unnamed protein product [Musa textilis]
MFDYLQTQASCSFIIFLVIELQICNATFLSGPKLSMECLHGRLKIFHQSTKENCKVMHLKLVVTSGIHFNYQFLCHPILKNSLYFNYQVVYHLNCEILFYYCIDFFVY